MNFNDILMIGCGKMGGALLDHWMAGGENFTIVDPALGSAPSPARLVADAAELGDEVGRADVGSLRGTSMAVHSRPVRMKVRN